MCIRDRALNLFNLKLHEAGYFDIHAAIYEKYGYSIRQENIYRISNGFPRITENSLLPGVGDVKYTIIVSDCQKFSINENELFNSLTFS